VAEITQVFGFIGIFLTRSQIFPAPGGASVVIATKGDPVGRKGAFFWYARA
jgi:hypothetical protein